MFIVWCVCVCGCMCVCLCVIVHLSIVSCHTSSIQHLLSTDATKTHVSTSVLSHLDYCIFCLALLDISSTSSFFLFYQKSFAKVMLD